MGPIGRFGIGERLAVAGLVLGGASLPVGLFFPTAYPDLINAETSRLIVWGPALLIGMSLLFAACDVVLHFLTKRGIAVGVALTYIGIGLMFIGAFVGTWGIRMLDRGAEATAPSNGPLQVKAIAFPIAHENGVRVAGIVWEKGYSRTEMQFTNALNEPITDLDVTIRPEFPIIKSVATSDFAKCRIGPSVQVPLPTIIGPSADGSMRVVADNASANDSANVMILDSHRLYCEKLASRAGIHVVLATVVATDDVMGPMWQEKRRDPSFVDVSFRYQAGGKKYKETFRLTFR